MTNLTTNFSERIPVVKRRISVPHIQGNQSLLTTFFSITSHQTDIGSQVTGNHVTL